MNRILTLLGYLSQGRAPDNPPALTLAEYVALAARLLPPTDQQKENFVRFVSQAHSWYKHLPLCLPGVKFRFFIDPSAGCERAVTFGGKVNFAPRVEQGFHYSWIPTAEYRQRFGYLAYSCGAGTKAFAVKWDRIAKPGDDVAAIPMNDGRLYALPPEVVRGGSVRLTAVIHNWSAVQADLWNLLAGIDTEHLRWPEDSGGREALQKIIARASEMRRKPLTPEERKSNNLGRIDAALISEEPELLYVDPELYQLLAPEQRRQRSEMVKAMQRVCDLIYS